MCRGEGQLCRNKVSVLSCAVLCYVDLQVLLLNNQHLGMVVQWEDRFYKVSTAQPGALQGQGLRSCTVTRGAGSYAS